MKLFFQHIYCANVDSHLLLEKKPNQPAKRPSACESFTRQFALISANKDYIPDIERVNLCVRWGIIVNGALSNEVVAASNRFLLDRGDGPPPAGQGQVQQPLHQQLQPRRGSNAQP